MVELPDFLKLSPEAVEAETLRQTRLKQEFNSRARQTPAEMEAARALLIEDSLRQAFKTEKNPDEKTRIANQLGENLSQQGRFLEAAKVAKDKDAKKFYAKAADAVFNRIECGCSPRVEMVADQRIKLPKYRVIKEIYSLKMQAFAYLVECNKCGDWGVIGSNPLPPEVLPENFTLDAPNDLETLKI